MVGSKASLAILGEFRYMIVIFLALCHRASSHSLRYQSIDEDTIRHFGNQWSEYHKTWKDIDVDRTAYCNDELETTVYPVCVGDYLLRDGYNNYDEIIPSNLLCPRVLCKNKNPSQDQCISSTPYDMVDYLPPVAESSLDNNTICSSKFLENNDNEVSSITFGMDLGLPPSYLPITPVRLNITGTVYSYANINGKFECLPIADAEIIAWQVDPIKLAPFSLENEFTHSVDLRQVNIDNEMGTPFSRTTYTSLSNVPETQLAEPFTQTLRDVSCRATQHSDRNGNYRFDTLVPPSYGPPRNIMFKISAPGYQPLVTRMYMDRDLRLYQLVTQGAEQMDSAIGPDSLSLALGFQFDRRDGSGNYSRNTNEAHYSFPYYPATKDPRVAKLQFVPSQHSSTPSNGLLIRGGFATTFNFVLSPTHVSPTEPTTASAGDGNTASISDKASAVDISGVPPIDINGLWADAQGGLIRIETHGPSFIAHEYPHARSWGTALGALTGNVIRNVDFLKVVSVEEETDAMNQQFTSSVSAETLCCTHVISFF